jgi:Inner membrane protein YgaP-like, transmembrane domain
MFTFLKKNEAAWDRGLRIVLGLVLLSLTVVGPKTLWGLLGLIPLVTGFAGSCPAYLVAGVSTCGSTADAAKP